MFRYYIRFASLAILLLISSSYTCAQETSNSLGSNGESSIKLSAPNIEYFGDKFRAGGGVVVDSGPIRMNAKEAEYKISPMNAKLSEVNFSTCKQLKPHYHLRAKSISLSHYGTVRSTNVSLYIGNIRLFNLPVLILKVGGRGRQKKLFPLPGYSSIDGYTLSYDFALIDNERFYLRATPTITSKNGNQANIRADYGINGALTDTNEKILKYNSLKEIAFDIEPEILIDNKTPPIKTASFKTEAIYSFTSEHNLLESKNTSVFRRPEIRLIYTVKDINRTNTASINKYIPHPNITLTYGNYFESKNAVESLSKYMLEAEIPVAAFNLGDKSVLSPFIAQRLSKYSNDNTYDVFSYGLNFIKIFNNGNKINLRYLDKNPKGDTPFEFDEVKVKNELQSAVQIWKKDYVFGFASAYDIDKSNIYDWEIMAGKRLDCMSYSISWNNRLKSLNFGLSLLGF